MKSPLLALLCIATAAFCQSSPAPSPVPAPKPAQVDPGHLFQMSQKFTLQAPAFKPSLASLTTLTTPAPYSTVITPGPTTPRKLKNPQIDPKFIVRPPWPSGEDQTKGQDLSRNQFPNLRYLPVRVGAAKTIALRDGASVPGRPPLGDQAPR